MLQKALEFLSQPKRADIIKTIVGDMLWNDPKRVYEPIVHPLFRQVCCVESIAAAVIEEGVRRNNSAGDHMTVIFGKNGALFHCDDHFRRDVWKYERQDSQQYAALKALLSGAKGHIPTLRAIQALRPSIKDADALLRQMRRVQATGKTTVTSNPLMSDGGGQAGGSIEWTMAAEGGATTKAAIPAEFVVELPIVRGSEKRYTVTVEIEAFLKGTEDNKKELAFSFCAPDLQHIIEQSIADEFAWFKAATMTKMPRLLVLLDY